MTGPFLNFIRIAVIPGLLASGLVGCSYHQLKDGAAGDGSHISKLSPSFAQVREQVFVPKCITCHHHQSDFSDYATTFASRDQIEQRVFVDHSMPENDILDADQSSLLKQWLDAGAPEQAQQPTAPVPAPTPAPTPKPQPSIVPEPGDPVADALASIRQSFELKIRPLVNRSCVACHDSHARPEGVLGHLPGIRTHEWNHIHAASKILDFSRTFPSWSTQNSNAVFFLDQIRATLQKNIMPPSDFKLAHHLDGRLLRENEKQAVIDWTIESEKLLAQADASRPTAAKIFQNRCLGCHSSDTHAGGLVFDVTGSDLKIQQGATSAGIAYLAPGVPENSAVFLVLSADPAARKGLAAMPRNSDPLSDQDREVVYDWIKGLSQP